MLHAWTLLSSRGPDTDVAGEHEASRRLKTELVVQMERCNPTAAHRHILVIGATNRPEVFCWPKNAVADVAWLNA